jgi:UTP--glucose-1-phosphate uridylyltransferase
VPGEDTSRYGVVDPVPGGTDGDGRLHKLRGLVEKPDPGQSPSDLAIIGRYVLTPKIFEKLEQTPHGAGDEIQLTDAIMALMAELKASVELALERPDIGAEFRRYLATVDLR